MCAKAKKSIASCASHLDHFIILNAMDKTRQKNSQLSAQEMNELEDIVYRYGGEAMILRTKEDTPVEVLQAYKTLNKIHGASKQCLKTVFVCERQKTMRQIKSIVFNSCKTYLPMILHGFHRLDNVLVEGSFDAMEVTSRPVLHHRPRGPT